MRRWISTNKKPTFEGVDWHKPDWSSINFTANFEDRTIFVWLYCFKDKGPDACKLIQRRYDNGNISLIVEDRPYSFERYDYWMAIPVPALPKNK
jgi:hypothetical protein